MEFYLEQFFLHRLLYVTLILHSQEHVSITKHIVNFFFFISFRTHSLKLLIHKPVVTSGKWWKSVCI